MVFGRESWMVFWIGASEFLLWDGLWFVPFLVFSFEEVGRQAGRLADKSRNRLPLFPKPYLSPLSIE